MTPQEFKAWFEGFTEAFDRLPTKAQWARVKDRVAEIDGKAVTERVYVDRYYPLWQRYYGTSLGAAGPLGGYATTNTVGLNNLSVAGSQYQNAMNTSNFNSSAAMGDLGRAEAKLLAA